MMGASHRNPRGEASAIPRSDLPRHVLVTGAASGIGAAVCRRFLSEGCRVTAVDQQVETSRLAGGRDAEVNGDTLDVLVGDLADAEFAEEVAKATWKNRGPVDVAVTAAGIYPAMTLLGMTVAGWDRVQAVNVRSAMQITAGVARLAISDGRAATVIHVSSGAAQRARPGAAAYCASKAALEMLTRSAALEFGPFGIRVNAVSPGFIGVHSAVNPVTEEYAAAMSVNPLGRPGRAEDVANAIYWLAGAEAGWINGAVVRVDGGASAGAFALPLHWTGQTPLQIPRSGTSGPRHG